jgi:MoaA/NifB/PqqE/SkfB family radical SAM enzyme
MCPTHSRIVSGDYKHAQKNIKDMDLAMFRDMIDRFSRATTVHIIGSGEPLLNKDFFEMVAYAAKKRMTVKTFSNGTTVGQNIDRILSSKLEGITISLNGQNAEEYARMTGMPRETYHKIYDAVKCLIEERNRTGSKLKVKLSFIIDRHNYKSIPDMIDVGLKLGADHIFLCNFLHSPYDGFRAHERVLMTEEKTLRELRAIIGRYPPAISKKVTWPVPVDPDRRENKCATHFSQVRFDGDGNVSSCSMMLLNMTGHGHYKEKNVWNNEYFRKMRKAFLSTGDEAIEDPCKACPDNRGVTIGK